MKKLSDLINEIDKCVKCGTCRSVCPIFKIGGREPSSTRGRLTLLSAYARGELGLTEAYIKQVKDCTLCGACTSNCPNSVDTPKIVAAARAEMIEKQGTSPVASFLFKSMKEQGKLMPIALKFASYLQGLILRGVREDSGLLSRFNLPIPGAGSGRLFPPLARTFFLDTKEAVSLRQEHDPGADNPGTVKVVFYVGCGINYLMPEVGLATVDVLKRAGAEVIIPPGQVCCGMPAYSTGDVDSARDMAIKNIEEFERFDFDYVVTSCATCGHGLRNNFLNLLADDHEFAPRAAAFSEKVRDISELLYDVLGFKSSGGAEKMVVTYHDPCHLGRAQGVREQPRDLIKTNKDLTLREMKNPCRCCGLGGGLSITNYELSSEIGKIKAESVKASGADVVATGCPGCMVQLRDSLHRIGVDAKVKHVVELL